MPFLFHRRVGEKEVEKGKETKIAHQFLFNGINGDFDACMLGVDIVGQVSWRF